MTTFNLNGKEWNLSITLGSARTVRNDLNVDLLNPGVLEDGVPLSQRLLYDDLFLAGVVECLLREQIVAEDLDDVAFLYSVDGAAFKTIEDAFWTEYKRFFTGRGKEWAVKAIEKDMTTRERNGRKALEQLSESTGETSANSQDAQASTTSNV